MLQVTYKKYVLKFNFPGGTSRGILYEKPSWFLKIWNKQSPQKIGMGEISLIPKLSVENEAVVEEELKKLKQNPENYLLKPPTYPAIRFGIETALQDLKNGGEKILYPSDFSKGKEGIKINGLVWMGSKAEMLERIKEKINQGFECIKIKVGAIDFEAELDLLKFIRKHFDKSSLELRVDANGAFDSSNALNKILQLSKHKLHSIEQPIKQGQWKQMAEICKNTTIPIALDEELIGIKTFSEKTELLKTIRPQYIVLKPSFIGGLAEAEAWRQLAKKHGVGWWVTSALEGNIGLNSIAQWTYQFGEKIAQGLGTGSVFSNNIASPLEVIGQKVYLIKEKKWEKLVF